MLWSVSMSFCLPSGKIPDTYPASSPRPCRHPKKNFFHKGIDHHQASSQWILDHWRLDQQTVAYQVHNISYSQILVQVPAATKIVFYVTDSPTCGSLPGRGGFSDFPSCPCYWHLRARRPSTRVFAQLVKSQRQCFSIYSFP